LLHLYYCNLLQLQVTEKSNLLPVTSLLVTSYYPTLVLPSSSMNCLLGTWYRLDEGDLYS